MTLVVDDQFHDRGDHAFYVAQKLASHLFGESDQGSALLWVGLLVDDEDSLGRIRIGVGIAQGGAGANYGGDGESVELHAVPASALDVPCQNGFIADEIHFAVSEA